MAIAIFNKVPPYGLIRNWLGTKTVEGLLNYAQSNERLFTDSAVGYGPEESAKVDYSRRRSRLLSELGGFQNDIIHKIQHLVPAMCERLGNTPFAPTGLETELAAHGDEAFFSTHVDTFHDQGIANPRVISLVYYFHEIPKAFTGGVLRLHSLGASGEQGTFVDIEPEYDTLIFFPSWFPHEVLPVKCPSRRFIHSRFAINCWVHS